MVLKINSCFYKMDNSLFFHLISTTFIIYFLAFSSNRDFSIFSDRLLLHPTEGRFHITFEKERYISLEFGHFVNRLDRGHHLLSPFVPKRKKSNLVWLLLYHLILLDQCSHPNAAVQHVGLLKHQ